MSDILQTIEVKLPPTALDRSYPIVIGRALLNDGTFWQPLIAGRGVVLVTDSQVGPLYASCLRTSLGAVSQITEVVLPAGEARKDIASLQTILDAALTDRQERGSVFIALGGGVVGDITGFAASCFLRGADFIQVPTTLLAQVDSSVGGKTGINHAMGKNLIGAFHQPMHVVIDLDTLASLPEREFAGGLAEVIKYGLIRDGDFFEWLLQHIKALKGRDLEALSYAIERSCEIKASIVAQDEREGGVRAYLNFGHTFGHAIERVQGYGNWLHGEAVAAGMVMASRISVARGGLDEVVVGKLLTFYEAFGLPTGPPEGMSARDFLQAMASDKKVTAGKVNYVLLSKLGQAMITDSVTHQEIAVLVCP